LALGSPLDRWRPARNPVFAREEPSRVPQRRDPPGATEVNYRAVAFGVTGVTASAAAPSLIRRAVGGVVGGREGRVTVRGSTVNLLQLAEETLRLSVFQPCGASSKCLLSRRGRVS
jgi:hypothetical protein